MKAAQPMSTTIRQSEFELEKAEHGWLTSCVVSWPLLPRQRQLCCPGCQSGDKDDPDRLRRRRRPGQARSSR